jgi:hypothetical protein
MEPLQCNDYNNLEDVIRKLEREIYTDLEYSITSGADDPDPLKVYQRYNNIGRYAEVNDNHLIIPKYNDDHGIFIIVGISNDIDAFNDLIRANIDPDTSSPKIKKLLLRDAKECKDKKCGTEKYDEEECKECHRKLDINISHCNGLAWRYIKKHSSLPQNQYLCY